MSSLRPHGVPKLTYAASHRLPTKNGTCQVQLVRSLCEWSGANRTERSLYRATLKEIEDAQYLIYIGTKTDLICRAR